MIYYICWLLSAIVGAIIGNTKGRPTAGGFWGLLLGPFGWLLIASVPDERPKCAECLSAVPEGARKCRYCGSAIEQVESPHAQSGLHSIVLNRTWCDCIAVVVIGSFLTYGWLSLEAQGESVRRTFQRIAAELEKSSPTSSAFSSSDTNSITLSKYNRLSTGINYRQACDILDAVGVQTAHNRIDGIDGVVNAIATTSYSWKNADGSNIAAIFQNDRMVTKAQFGLH